MTTLLQPQHFITRENGSIVPVVAVDELPPTVNLQNVPRMLQPHQTNGMTCLGSHTARHQKYVVEKEINPFPPSDKTLMGSAFAAPASVFPPIGRSQLCGPKSPPLTPKDDGQSASSCLGSTRSSPRISSVKSHSSDNSDPEFYNMQRMQKSQNRQFVRPEVLDMAPGRKEYCSYWLRHGECDYAQQGCLYKHEMPLDRDTLHKLGLKDIPKWYREEYGLASLQAGHISIGIEDRGRDRHNWRDQSVSAPSPLVENVTRDMANLSFSSKPNRPTIGRYTTRQALPWAVLNRSPYASPFPVAPRGPTQLPASHYRTRKTNIWDDPPDLLSTPNTSPFSAGRRFSKDLISLDDNESTFGGCGTLSNPSTPMIGTKGLTASMYAASSGKGVGRSTAFTGSAIAKINQNNSSSSPSSKSSSRSGGSRKSRATRSRKSIKAKALTAASVAGTSAAKTTPELEAKDDAKGSPTATATATAPTITLTPAAVTPPTIVTVPTLATISSPNQASVPIEAATIVTTPVLSAVADPSHVNSQAPA
ncbi:putative c-x8-c-x5-c-x3-h type zinc finger protein [Phaeomoniella chlamydospora]|uniref:Putative c-x8-c-x5-c-x3-h type zinc finger protein n=1 Tax=Phaeomoniella chlamydospora TaxID=158046 RepID=A0A0G2ESD3_PHACM|nr:putative c-x8-c-x5-c-x3-h type zinc finger protein [Phaeomoniella chlamydospora]